MGDGCKDRHINEGGCGDKKEMVSGVLRVQSSAIYVNWVKGSLTENTLLSINMGVVIGREAGKK